jgi:hypothetical protein
MIRHAFGGVTALGVAVLLTTAVLTAGQTSDRAKARTPAPAAVDPAYAQKGTAPNVTLPPLPIVSFEPVEPVPVLRQVYEFAARHPEVLQYIPCYCGCEAVGHKANHDCFVKSRAADGRVTQWDSHGMGCAVCLGVGRRAMTLFNQGMSVAEIRATIDREAGSKYPSHTPTPDAPRKRG